MIFAAESFTAGEIYILVRIRSPDSESAAYTVNRISPDTAIHEQNGYAKLLYHKYNILMTIVDNDNSDTTHTDMRNMQN